MCLTTYVGVGVVDVLDLHEQPPRHEVVEHALRGEAPVGHDELLVDRAHHDRSGGRQHRVEVVDRLVAVEHERLRALREPVDGLGDRHLRHEDLLVAAGHLEQRMAPVVREDRAMARVLGRSQQLVGRRGDAREVPVGHARHAPPGTRPRQWSEGGIACRRAYGPAHVCGARRARSVRARVRWGERVGHLRACDGGHADGRHRALADRRVLGGERTRSRPVAWSTRSPRSCARASASPSSWCAPGRSTRSPAATSPGRTSRSTSSRRRPRARRSSSSRRPTPSRRPPS